jgi:ketosteroid isomerase-like protein
VLAWAFAVGLSTAACVGGTEQTTSPTAPTTDTSAIPSGSTAAADTSTEGPAPDDTPGGTQMMQPDEAEIHQSHRDMYQAMLARDVKTLKELLADEYTLTHITGYRQSKNEWLEQIASGEMQYHSAQERSATVDVDGNKAVLVGRDRVDATIWGARGTYNLQLTTAFERRAGRWTPVGTVATTF